MPDVRFEVGFTHHPKLAGIDLLALGLHIRGIDYAAANLTDGFVAASALDELAALNGLVRVDSPNTLPSIGETITHGELVAVLIRRGLWHETDGGYLIHDFADYQVTRSALFRMFDRVERKRAADRERVGSRRGGALSRDKSENVARPPTRTKPPERSSSVSEKTPSPNVLPAGELDDFDFDAGAGLLGEITRSLRDSQGQRTLRALQRVSEGLSPQAIRDEFEALQRRRVNTSRGPIRSESAWFVDRLKKRREREAVRDLAASELLGDVG